MAKDVIFYLDKSLFFCYTESKKKTREKKGVFAPSLARKESPIMKKIICKKEYDT